MGDFNFHFENVENNNRKLHDMIDMFNLTQSVSEPQQYCGAVLWAETGASAGGETMAQI